MSSLCRLTPDHPLLISPVMTVYTAIVEQSGDDWIGWIEEIPGVNCQEATREELLTTLRITLEEALNLNRADAR